MSEYSNPKCYARRTQKCSGKISGEHIISKNVLKIFEDNKKVKIGGLPSIGPQRFDLRPINTLVSNVLCSNHNSLLSDYDTEGGKLIRCFGEYDADFNNPSPSNEHRTINGDLIERWMLKTICGLMASRQISNNGNKVNVSIPDQFVDILFEGAKFPEQWGLYFKIPGDQSVHHYSSVGFMPITTNGEIKVGDFLFNNFQFYLVLENFKSPSIWGTHRIEKIIFKQGDVTKTIEIKWDSKHDENSWIELNRIGTSRDYPQNWEDWMKE